MYEKIGDATAFVIVRDHFKLLFESVSAEQGGLVKTIGDAVMASFPRPAFALRAALRMHEQMAAFNEHEKPAFPVRLKVGLHAGPCIAVNLNDKLDYFGTTVNMAARIQNESEGDDIVLLESVASDPEVAQVLEAAKGRRDTFEAELKGLTGKFRLVRFHPQRGGGPLELPMQRGSTRFKKTNLFGA
jgi:class 3 adenylate cyclase